MSQKKAEKKPTNESPEIQRDSTPVAKKTVLERTAPPENNPHHCPHDECALIGKYTGRQQQSEKYTLIAWACEAGHHWGYTYPNNELPDKETLV